MCYTKALGGYFKAFWESRERINHGAIAVFKDFDQVIKKQLSRLLVASCGYASPVTDPFQPLERVYKLTEKTVRVFTELGLPIEFITKMGRNVPDDVYEMIASHPHNHSFCQYTIMTPHDDILREISPLAHKYEWQLDAIIKAKEFGVKNVVARFDPIFPFATDSREDIERMMKDVKDAGANHVIMSCVDVPKGLQTDFFDLIERITDIKPFKKLYKNDQSIAGDLNASLSYRNDLFTMGRDLATKHGLTFSLCMEFEKYEKDGQAWYKGFNDKYMTSVACEGIAIPMYHRDSLNEKFRPLSVDTKCDGNCLSFAKIGTQAQCKGECDHEPFQKAMGLKLKDYRAFKK